MDKRCDSARGCKQVNWDNTSEVKGGRNTKSRKRHQRTESEQNKLLIHFKLSQTGETDSETNKTRTMSTIFNPLGAFCKCNLVFVMAHGVWISCKVRHQYQRVQECVGLLFFNQIPRWYMDDGFATLNFRNTSLYGISHKLSSSIIMSVCLVPKFITSITIFMFLSYHAGDLLLGLYW